MVTDPAPNIARIPIGWSDKPAIAVARTLLDTLPFDELSNTCVVTHASRASKLILTELLSQANDRQSPISPPLFVTPAQLTHLLAGKHKDNAQPASKLNRWLAWQRVIQSASETHKASLALGTTADALSRATDWIMSMHDRVTAGSLGFKEASARLQETITDSEQPVWIALAELENAYESTLQSAALHDANLTASRKLGSPSLNHQTISHIALACMLELSPLQRKLIHEASHSITVTALCPAPESELHKFDGTGCVLPDQWNQALPGINSLNTAYAHSVQDQADIAIDAIASTCPTEAASNITLVAPNAETIDALTLAAQQTPSLSVRPAEGRSTAGSAIPTLLIRAQSFLNSNSFEDLSTLLRHPHVSSWIDSQLSERLPRSPWLESIDNYATALAPRTNPSPRWPGADKRSFESLRAVSHALNAFLAPLAQDNLSPPEWDIAIRTFILNAFSDHNAQLSDIDQSALSALDDLLTQLAQSPLIKSLDRSTAIQTITAHISNTKAPEQPNDAAVDIIGYLELLFEPAQHIIITSMNDGLIPSRPIHDAVLHPQVCRILGIDNTEQRQARDAAVLAITLNSSQSTTAIATKTTAEGDPLQPSRLLFQRDANDIPIELTRFTTANSNLTCTALRATPPPATPPQSSPPTSIQPSTYTPPQKISVTAFKNYLKSPALFYLRNIRRIQHNDLHHHELSPAAFGTLLHRVTERFDKLGGGNTDSEQAIQSSAAQAIQDIKDELFNNDPNPAVAVQLEMIKHRMDSFASLQTQWASLGWRIHHTEWSPKENNGAIEFNGHTHPCLLSGQVDRIDINVKTGKVALLDYKTGAQDTDPHKSHRKKDSWIDLQLPLYRHLAREIINDRPIKLGYIHLARKAPTAAPGTPALAEWTQEQLKEADNTAKSIIDHVCSSTPTFEVAKQHPVGLLTELLPAYESNATPQVDSK